MVSRYGPYIRGWCDRCWTERKQSTKLSPPVRENMNQYVFLCRECMDLLHVR